MQIGRPIRVLTPDRVKASINLLEYWKSRKLDLILPQKQLRYARL
jgi:hypothetical protein